MEASEELNRLRWRCTRRAMLEMDLLLGGFLEKRFSSLTPEQAQAEIGQVVEGVLAARAVHEVAQRVGVEMPIAEQIYRVLYEGAPAKEAVYALMGRTVKSETD